MAKRKKHDDEAVIDFFQELFKLFGFTIRDDWDVARARLFLGCITFLAGVLVPLFFEARWLVAILLLATIGLWWNFIVRASVLIGVAGMIEGILPIFQVDKEMEGPITNDGRIAAAHTYNFLGNAAAIFVGLMFIPLISPIPLHEVRYGYLVVMLLLGTAGLLKITVPTKRIDTVGGVKQKPAEKTVVKKS